MISGPQSTLRNYWQWILAAGDGELFRTDDVTASGFSCSGHGSTLMQIWTALTGLSGLSEKVMKLREDGLGEAWESQKGEMVGSF